MDERQRLIEHLYSREGAEEELREYRHPATGESVWMTPGQWALAEYDREHSDAAGNGVAAPEDAAHDAGIGTGDIDDTPASAEAEDAASPSPTAGSRRARRRKAVPYLAAAGGLVLGALVVLGAQGVVGTVWGPDGTGGAASSGTADAAGPTTGPGNGDEADTLEAVTRYFASAPRIDDLSADVTRGFDATSFHLVAGSVMMEESSAIYAARRLDGEYCLVAVTDQGRAAETCATMDDLARRGLTLTKDAVRDLDGRPLAITVIWQTDGTISWEAMPSAG